ncbi:amino acid synthesis family protein [Sulfitobacter pseudonitzschiae]|uniref:Amino acid synthesis family protein n=1 Tax=Pseudosulfitobacter pseudonitzschiae TaxID=1402135 RepID=A0A9Q2RUA8_9RHOB|nr:MULTISPECIES: amino acid synthesis family protein [Roseobacteraceae]MBM2291787.1 amino acid synthesis family protein [Pseudosulfitobacter pseudonitzschiae]MBM2296705.1 amino acid synthesis family protein [Pseudosulfitobacter pseudonitzschiae]MBM2301618.1 amino acid synthesis family protein [Pseudosulfitobacter pseudonitzschiae]MBM2311401.1 amino acid synthesis family protein [Pseudosulfitobacter pseudonitzschiae]MBM2316315.1 amino acid synthesis family protein [Pseudosulfitobacter pseudonit
MTAEIRKTLLHVEETLIEGGKAAPVPLKMIAAVAVIKNPWAGQGFVEDLKPEIENCAPGLGKLLTRMVLDAAGGGDKVEGYGKSAIVGTDGEVEHASALIHTLRFGNHYREAVGAKSYLAFCNTRGPANAPLMIPLMDKNDGGKRSHYLTIQLSVADAPAADEIVIALGASIGGRPHHRIGDRYQDLKELGHDVENPAAV